MLPVAEVGQVPVAPVVLAEVVGQVVRVEQVVAEEVLALVAQAVQVE